MARSSRRPRYLARASSFFLRISSSIAPKPPRAFLGRDLFASWSARWYSLTAMLERAAFSRVSEAVLAEAATAADPGAYSIRVTSGTMSGQPILVVRRRTVPGKVPSFDYYAGAAAIVKCHGPFTGRLYRLSEFILDYGNQGRRMLVLDPTDLAPTLEPV